MLWTTSQTPFYSYIFQIFTKNYESYQCHTFWSSSTFQIEILWRGSIFHSSHFSFKSLIQQRNNYKKIMYFSIQCFPADLFSQSCFLRFFPRVVFWEAFFLGVCKLLVLINVLIISSLSFTFCVRGNFSFLFCFSLEEWGAIFRV